MTQEETQKEQVQRRPALPAYTRRIVNIFDVLLEPDLEWDQPERRRTEHPDCYKEN